MPPSLGRALAVIAARPVPPIHGPAAAATTRICVTSAAPGPGPGQPVGAPPTSAEALPWRSRNAHSWPPPPPPPPASSPLRPAATAARQCLVVTSGRLAQPRCHADAGAAGHGGTVANLPDRQRCAAVSHAPAQQLCREPCAGSTAKQGRWLGNRRASRTNWPARCGRHRAIATEGSARTYRLWQSSRRRCDPAHDPPTRVSLVAQTRPIFSR